MRVFPPISQVKPRLRRALSELIDQVDPRYAALPLALNVEHADAADRDIRAGAERVFRTASGLAEGLNHLRALRDHLKDGGEIPLADDEPETTQAARQLRAARMAGALAQQRLDTVIAEMTAHLTEAGEALRVLVEDLQRQGATLDVAMARQRLLWLQRVRAHLSAEDAGPEVDLEAEEQIYQAQRGLSAAMLKHRAGGRQ